MKKVIYILSALFIVIVMSSCDDDFTVCDNDGYIESNGLILGSDDSYCACCGGWYIQISTDTMRIMDMPDNFDTALYNLDMPVEVVLSWKQMENGCGATTKGLIEVKSIQLK